MLDFFYSISKQETKVFFLFFFVGGGGGGGGRRRWAQRQSFEGHKTNWYKQRT